MKLTDQERSSNLALLDELPGFVEPIPVGAPILGDQECLLRYIKDILDRKWLSNNGFYVQELEHRIATRLGVKHCVTVCNATVGLQLVLMALDIKGEVILPSFTFIATPHAVVLSGGTPVFCDIDPNDHNLDPDEVERLIGPDTQAILGVHMWGNPCQTDRLEALAEKHGLQVIYDAAHAFDCSHKGRAIGHNGRAEVFSFHATKIFNSGEGGAVVTNDDDLANKIRQLRNFGRTVDGDVVDVGLNAKMSEFTAAVGLVNLEQVDNAISRSRTLYHLYRKAISTIPGLEIYAFNEEQDCNYHFVPVRVTSSYGVPRDKLMTILHAHNVMVQRYFYPGCHQTGPYVEKNGSRGDLQHTYALANEILILPTYPALSADDLHHLVELLRAIQQRALYP